MPIHRLTPDTMWGMYNTAHHTVRAGNTVYISGQVAVDEHGNDVGVGDLEAQIGQIYKNLENACRAHGGTLANIVKTVTYMTDRSYYQPVFKARIERYGPHLPTNTGILVDRLLKTEWLLEIEAVACLDEPIHRLNPDNMWDLFGSSHHTVRAGNALYISGQNGVDEKGNNVGQGDIEVQLRQTYKNLENACLANGATLANMVKTVTYMDDVSNYGPVFKIRKEAYGADLPTNTGILWAGVYEPDWIFEIEGVAYLDTPIVRLNPDNMWDLWGSSHVTVKAGNTLYISGQVSADEHGNVVGEGDVQAQIDQIYKNLEIACRAHGGTLANIVKTNTYMTDMSCYEPVLNTRKEVYGPNLPTSTGILIPGLAKPEWLVEIEAIAWIE